MSLPIRVLLFDVSGRGGVARTVVNLVNQLVERHEVEVISLFHRNRPRFPLDPRIRLRVLTKPEGQEGWVHGKLASRATRLRPRPSETRMSLLTDVLLRQALRGLDGGILVTTRPSLHLAAVRYAPKSVKIIGQEHLNVPTRWSNRLQAGVLSSVVPRLDAYVVLTEDDSADYRRLLPGITTDLRVIRNALPWPVPERGAPLISRTVVAAGRLAPEKGFGRLIDAYEPVGRAHPDWRLQIYGTGTEGDALRARIAERELGDLVELKGYSSDMQGMLAEASVFALSSRKEGFPMALIEAMSVGLPLVAFDCPRGPAEIVRNGRNGLLVPDGDVAAFSAALRLLVEDEEQRRAMGAAALADAHAYEVGAIVAQWEQLFDDVMALPRR